MNFVHVAGGPAGVSALLSHLQQMTQLTHLALQRCGNPWAGLDVPYDPSGPPAAAYAALTASSTLQYLNVSGNTMPQSVLQHMLPADRQLSQLLVVAGGALGRWAHADTARLSSCCPNLLKLAMRTNQPLATQVLQPLRSLAALTALEGGELDDAGLAAAAAELTQLRRLKVFGQERVATDAGLLQLTQLRQLTELAVYLPDFSTVSFYDEVHQPVWRQVLQHCMMSAQPGVPELAQQAAASLKQPAA